MFVGHFGIAQLGKGVRRDLPFALLLVSAYLPDIVRVPAQLLTRQHELYTHSIPVITALSLAMAVLWLLRGGRPAAAAMLALVCLLHWPADVFTGCKPTTFGGPWIGFVSYRRPVNDILVEGGLLIAGWLLSTRRGFRIGKLWIVLAFAVQITFLVSMYLGSQFLIGDREWMWKPQQSLIPQPHVLEDTPCRPVK